MQPDQAVGRIPEHTENGVPFCEGERNHGYLTPNAFFDQRGRGDGVVRPLVQEQVDQSPSVAVGDRQAAQAHSRPLVDSSSDQLPGPTHPELGYPGC